MRIHGKVKTENFCYLVPLLNRLGPIFMYLMFTLIQQEPTSERELETQVSKMSIKISIGKRTRAVLIPAQANSTPKLSPMRECRPNRIDLLASTTLCNGQAYPQRKNAGSMSIS